MQNSEPISEEIRYAWFDEDGQQMSPTHEKLRSALNFANGWQTRWERLQHYAPRDALFAVTRTGKPPVELRQLIVRTYIGDLSPGQREIAQAYLDDIHQKSETP